MEIECCARFAGKLKVIARIEEQQFISKVLEHLEHSAPEQHQPERPPGSRDPPAAWNSR